MWRLRCSTSGYTYGDARSLCEELKSHNIPFIVYSGYPPPTTLDVPFIAKPAHTTALVEAIEALLAIQRPPDPLRPELSEMSASR
jgi:hypothetical protein